MRLKVTTVQTSRMGMGGKTGAYAACLTAALLLGACNDAKVCQDCSEGGGETCPTSPTLVASAGDGEVTLRWRPAVGLRAPVKDWQFRQAVQEKRWSSARGTGPAATAYVVSGLANDMAYTFQVRAQLAADFGCWSAPVSVVPRRMDDVMAEMAKQQKAIAGHMADLVNGMAARQELLEQGIAALKAISTAGNTTAQSTHNIYHTTFAFRFAPPWFNADQRSLFTSYVVFPEEAKFERWIADQPDETCDREQAPAAVCPDRPFYEETMKPFLEGLSQCATTEATTEKVKEKVQLQLVGFASSTGVKDLSDESKDELEEHYGSHIAANTELCRGETVKDETKYSSNMFNLLIANERAVNVAAMLESFVPVNRKDAFAIKAIPWCSHRAMVKERRHDDSADPAKGLMNRRVEVRLKALPGCLNFDPDSRIDVTGCAECDSNA